MNRSKAQRDAEVMNTMGILDRMPEVRASHLFRARLLERIEESEAHRSPGGYAYPRLAFFSLLLAINIAMGALLFLHQTPQVAPARNLATTESYSEDYGSPALSYYDQQNDNPTGENSK